MPAQKTSKNQVMLLKRAPQEIPETDYSDVTTKNGVLIPRPVTVTEPGSRLTAMRQTIKDHGIEPKTWIVLSHEPEDTMDAAGDSSRAGCERRHLGTAYLRATVVPRLCSSGDDDVLSLHRVKSVEIVSVTAFLQHLKHKP
jgi:hypothetical protein